jgi:AcrR family transcriptional regulator
MTRKKSVPRRNTSQLLRRATVRVVARRGIDSASVSEIVRQANLTSGAVYGKFESRDDLFLDVWDQGAGSALFEHLEKRLSTWRDGKPFRQEDITEDAECGLQMFVMARRSDYMAETIQRDFSKFLAKCAVVDSGKLVKSGEALIIALELADLMYQAVRQDSAAWGQAREVFDEVTRQLPTSRVLDGGAVKRSTAPEPAERSLNESAVRTIARVGFTHATLSRIARGANVTTGSIFAQFDSREEFFRAATAQIFGIAASQVDRRVSIAPTRDLLTATFSSLLTFHHEGPRHEWNSFRLECFLAARNTKFMRSELRSILSAGRSRYEELLLPATGFDPDYLNGVMVVGQGLPVGLHLFGSHEPSTGLLRHDELVHRLLVRIGVR